MLPKKKVLFCLCVVIWIFLLNSAHAEKRSSLTFVIDDTGSMYDDIAAVKRSANEIFATVMNSNKSQIEDFVLTTFNDPGVRHRTTTRDRDAFKTALANINVDGGDDCPEMAMSGIELALQESRPASLLYVFTDANAKDPGKHGVVKNLAQAKQIQVVFVLTGKCNGEGNEEVFYQLATETGGQVFNLMKRDEVADILDFVKTQINNRKPTLAIKDFPPGTHQLQFEVDSKMKELVISVSGRDHKFTVTDPDGKPAPLEEIKTRKSFAFVKVTKVKPGTYTAEVTSTERNSIKITAETTVHFEHGFSLTIPTSLKETVTRPIPGEPSYLSIKLATGDTRDVVLDMVLILDLDHRVLVDKPLKLVNDKDQFYVTEMTLIPPNQLFRVAIKGHDTKSNEIITRISLTPIEPQSRDTPTENKTPTITLIGEHYINMEYNEALSLKCKVSGYPKPKVIWQSGDGTIMDSTLSLVEYPYDYLSTLSISQVISNATYYCIARNSYGGDSKKVQVVTARKTYFNVIKKPIGAMIETTKEALFECEVDAYPPAKINWYKDGKELIEDYNVNVSTNRTKLLIKHMLPYNVGRYTCTASNENERQQFHFYIQISGTEPPVIDKAIGEIRVTDGENVEIPCNIISGNPIPRILWFYEDADGIEYSVEKNKDTEKISLSGVTRGSIGFRTYRCEAHNEIGSDFHRIDLIFDYPPRINGKENTEIVARVGDRLNMDCDVEGEPKPTVQWLLNDKELVLTTRHGRGYSHGFNFWVTEEDTGIYVCEATNDLGTVNKTIDLRIVRPAQIEVPEATSVTIMVGEYLNLPCRASGFPNPHLEWIFHSLDPKIGPQNLSPRESGTLTLGRMQIEGEGFYTCVASNDGGTFNITYDVKVLAPPNIENIFPEKTFTGVEKDLVLRVPCYATGNPKPEITWIKDGVDKVAADTEWYDIDKDGTLVIKNLDKLSAGTYVCEARNSLGIDTESYEVIVEAFPRLGTPTKTVNIEEGHSTILGCDIPHKRTDNLRWFKDGREVSLMNGNNLINAQFSDAGIYACRVSDFAKSRSGFIKVNVGFAPRFHDEKEEEAIEFVEGLTAVMDCTADAYPHPEVSWWHKGEKLPVKTMKYMINMKFSNRGQYHCLVKNEFGMKHHKFNIASQECLLDIQSELTENQPLILSPDMTWPKFETNEGHIRITPNDTMLLACSSNIKNIHKKQVMISCKQNTFKVDGKSYKFSDLQCENRFMPVASRTSENCLISNPDSKTVRIGYQLSGTFLEVFEICLDMKTRVPLYAKHRINHALANVKPKVQKWHKTRLVSYNTDELYNCNLQINTISSLLRSWFHREDKCCFSRRLLVNPRDVLPGLSQMATYTVLNVVPHWSTCNSENWESVENRVRVLARSSSVDLLVWTGAAERLQMSGQNISIYDKTSGELPVPKYLWKVVQDPTTKASLAIIQLNIPDVTVTEVHSHLPCRDICREVSWMKNEHWRDVTKGYTFCCNILEFERALGYYNIFNSGTGKVLYDISLLRGERLTSIR